ncbi:MAG TPA: acyl-CoA dehydrogenase family protein, partial [Trebonia sp.]|nr:acyl-CoA dehydrogenase family protein [Trebonia sp.]
MAIDFGVDKDIAKLRQRVRDFIDTQVIPYETALKGQHGLPDEVRATLQGAAREAALFAPHMPAEYGGLGLDTRGQAVIFEEAGRSPLGPIALNCAAPDEGNMLLLERVATAAQRDRYLRPLAEGRIRSCFAMTEPAPGAGADPDQLTTSAVKVGDEWRISGRKHFITGAQGASFAIVMARTSDRGATMFLVDAGNPGMSVTRVIDTIDSSFSGGHAEVSFSECRVGDEAVLGQPDEGFRYAQVRLGPARLTHCMRWLGLATRAHDIAVGYAAQRRMFGSRLGELGMAQAQIADNEIDIAASRALIWQAAWALDSGQPGRQETSVAKVFVAEAVGRVLDRSVQLCGALGVSADLPLAWFLAEV